MNKKVKEMIDRILLPDIHTLFTHTFPPETLLTQPIHKPDSDWEIQVIGHIFESELITT